MVIVMQEGATDAQIQHVIDRLVASGFNVHRSTGESHTRPRRRRRSTAISIIAISNCSKACDEVMRITQPFKLASRQFKPEGTIVDLGRGVKSAAGSCRRCRPLLRRIPRANLFHRR